MKNFNRFAREKVLQKFPFLAELPTGLQLHNADEFSVRRMDEGFLRSSASEYSWRDRGDCLHDDTNFFFVNGGKFSGRVSVDLMVAEALKELPDFILEFRYRDINRNDYRLELILWKRPKDAMLLEKVVKRLKEEVRSELTAEISEAEGENPSVDSFEGSLKGGVDFVSAPKAFELSLNGSCFQQIGVTIRGFSFKGFTMYPKFTAVEPRVLDCDEIHMRYSTGWTQLVFFTELGIQQVLLAMCHSCGVKETLTIYVLKDLLPELKMLFQG